MRICVCKPVVSVCFLVFLLVYSIRADDIDISDQKRLVEDLGLPSVPRMSALILKAEQAYASSDWTTAIILYDRVSQETNWLANVISAAANPYYNATADELVDFSAVTGASLVPCETAANDYKHQRNIALARIGFCYEKLGKPKDAIPYLLKALELITITEDVLW